jgi:hypothetical protein
MLTSVRLVDGDREMVLLPNQDDGIFLQGLDAPMPEVREAVEVRTDDDGTRDTTGFFGARAATLDILVTQGARAVEDELTRYLHPRSRPYLVVEDDGWSQARRLGLRVESYDAPLTVDLPRDARRISVGWKVPTGIWEADEATETTVNADLASTTGRTYPKAYPWAYAATMAAGASLLTNTGSAPSHFTARLYGPCTGPSLVNETTDEELTFLSSLVLGAGEYVEIDTRERTAYALSSTSASRLTYIDFEATSWWRIEPGENLIRYAPSDADAGSAAVITYRPAWL